MLGGVKSGNEIAHRPGESLAPKSVWNELGDLWQRIENMFTRYFGSAPRVPADLKESIVFEPDIDLFETEDQVTLIAAVPGYKLSEISVEAEPQSVTIQGKHEEFAKEEKKTLHRMSWVSSDNCFCNAFTLPCEIDPKKIKATLRDGVLKVEMPKTEQSRAKTVKVAVEAK